MIITAISCFFEYHFYKRYFSSLRNNKRGSFFPNHNFNYNFQIKNYSKLKQSKLRNQKFRMDFSDQIADLIKKYPALEPIIQVFESSNQDLILQAEKLMSISQELDSENQLLKADNHALKAENQTLKAENQTLKLKIQELAKGNVGDEVYYLTILEKDNNNELKYIEELR